MNMAGRRAFITGASSGIGRGTARAFAAAGAKVALSARSADKLEALCEEIRGAGGDAEAFPADVTDSREVARALELAAVVGLGLGFRGVARRLVALVPGFGWLFKALVAYISTSSLGAASVRYFESGAPASTAQRFSTKPVSIIPNAGIPENVDGIAVFPMQPEPFARQLRDMVEQFGVDATFYDTSGSWTNDPNHPVFEGMMRLRDRQHRRALEVAVPRLLEVCVEAGVLLDQVRQLVDDQDRGPALRRALGGEA